MLRNTSMPQRTRKDYRADRLIEGFSSVFLIRKSTLRFHINVFRTTKVRKRIEKSKPFVLFVLVAPAPKGYSRRIKG